MEECVSVIIPVFNTEKYLRRCLNSVRNQTWKNIEVFVIDDGSTDNSAAICDFYAAKDSRFHVIHQKNAGQSSARNAGLDEISSGGGYTFFLDSDDWLPKRSIELLLRGIRQGADLCCGEYQTVYAARAKPSNCYQNPALLNKEEKNQFARFLRATCTVPWGKLYRNEIIRAHHLRFSEEFHLNEDALFLYTYLQYVKNIAVICDSVYFYNRLTVISATGRYYPDANRWWIFGFGVRLKLFDGVFCQSEIDFMLTEFYDALKYYIRHLPKEEAIVMLKKTHELYKDYLYRIDCSGMLDSEAPSLIAYRTYGECLRTANYDRLYQYIRENSLKKEKNPLKSLIKKLLRPIAAFAIFQLQLGYKD